MNTSEPPPSYRSVTDDGAPPRYSDIAPRSPKPASWILSVPDHYVPLGGGDVPQEGDVSEVPDGYRECGECGAVVEDAQYLPHKSFLCPHRPMQCPKCLKLIHSKDLEEHR